MNQIGYFKVTINKKSYRLKCNFELAQHIESVLNEGKENKNKHNLPTHLLNFITNGMPTQDACKLTEAIMRNILKKSIKITINNIELQDIKNQMMYLIGVCIGGEEFGKKSIKMMMQYDLARKQKEIYINNTIQHSGTESRVLH